MIPKLHRCKMSHNTWSFFFKYNLERKELEPVVVHFLTAKTSLIIYHKDTWNIFKDFQLVSRKVSFTRITASSQLNDCIIHSYSQYSHTPKKSWPHTLITNSHKSRSNQNYVILSNCKRIWLVARFVCLCLCLCPCLSVYLLVCLFLSLYLNYYCLIIITIIFYFITKWLNKWNMMEQMGNWMHVSLMYWMNKVTNNSWMNITYKLNVLFKQVFFLESWLVVLTADRVLKNW